MMKQDVVDDVSARKFLLGELSQEERSAIEEQAFVDRDSFALLQAAEDDLIDEYLCGDLTADESEQFEKYFKSEPGRSADLRIAKALQQYIAQQASPSRLEVNTVTRARSSLGDWLGILVTPSRLSLAPIVLIIAAATGIWFAIRYLRQPSSAPPILAQQQPTESPTPANNSQTPSGPVTSPTQKDRQIKPPPSREPPASLYSVVLIPGGPVRGESKVTQLQLPSAAEFVSLQLPLIEEGSYRSYQAILQTDDGTTIRSWPKLSASSSESGKAIQVNVPVSLLARRRSYRILLRGKSSNKKVQEISTYRFQVN